MTNKLPQLRLNCVRYYLKNGQSLRAVALRFSIHYITLFKWVKMYREKGEAQFLSTYRSPWNRATKKLEKRIVILKESNPGITLKNAQDILQKEGIKINPTVILVEKDPALSVSIDFETGTIEFNPKCQKQPVFKKMIRKGGLHRFLEYSLLIEILKHKMNDRKRALMEAVRKYPEYLDMIGAAMGLSKKQLRLAQKRAGKVGR